MSVPKIVVHTDVFLDHLCCTKHPSVLRQGMSKFFCYTTVYQAIELFSLAKTEEEVKAIEDSMAAMKLMGLNPKNARKYGELTSSNKKTDHWNILIAGLCIESRLPILTDRRKDFSGIKGLTVVPTKLIENEMSGEEILQIAQHNKS
ncbi:MAG: hypothetical protein AAB209_08595 [Bacteroidota bacterium]